MKPGTTYPVAVRASALRVGEAEVEVDVEVENRADRSLLVVDELRRVTWDSATRTVELWLVDAPDGGEHHGTCRTVALPKTREVPAGKTVTFPLKVARVLWRLSPRADADPIVERDDLGQVATALIHIAVADTPFYPTMSGPTAAEQAAAWGQVLTITARRTGTK